jgi:Fic family protein
MGDRRAFVRLAAAVDEEARRLRLLSDRSAVEASRLALEEIHASTRFAGATLDADDVAALVERGVAVGGRMLDEYIVVADYAAAARYGAQIPMPGRRRVFLRLEEVVALHALAARREAAALPGIWRRTTARAYPSGVVPPPAWLVPREMAAFVERAASGPGAETSPLTWVASAHERFARIHPFEKANGRVGRLVTNLLLRRLGLPPFAVTGRAAERYRAALARADARDPWPLAAAIAGAVLKSLQRLVTAAEPDGELRSLASFAAGSRRAALYKAAQRGRLRSVRRGGTLYTSDAWIEEYETRAASSQR